MVIRTLEPEEYPSLKSVDGGFVPDPANSLAVAALEEDKIVGKMFVVAMPHIEGTWVAPEKRNGSIGFRLERAACEEAKRTGLKTLMAYTTDPKHTEYMERLGWTRTNFTVLTKEL